MKKSYILTTIFKLSSFLCLGLGATEISCPKYEGGFYGGASWLYLNPTPTDGDFEYGTLITLTTPPNLTAHMQEFDPGYNSAVRGFLGYRLPCSGMFLELGYFYFGDNKRQGINSIQENQLIQNFLGGAFATVDAYERQTVNQADLKFGQKFLVDSCLEIEPFVGIAFADIRRDIDVDFTDFLLSVNPSNLAGRLQSGFCGVGPIIGAKFDYSMWGCFSFSGHIGGGALIGKVQSCTGAIGLRDGEDLAFLATDCYARASTMLNSGLALTYKTSLCGGAFGFEITLGYEVDYYFKAIDRIDPSLGFYINPNPVPVKVSSNLGLAGPYVQVALFDTPNPYCLEPHFCSNNTSCGFYVEASALWLKPRATNKDLTFATLHTDEESDRDVRVKPDYAWSGYYDVGYRFGCNNDVRLSYFHLYTTDRKTLVAGDNQNISSLNASGAADVVYTEASSRVKYQLNQVDLVVGKSICCVHPFVGLRYLDLQRFATNAYSGGIPTETAEFKTPTLKSKYYGVGLLFGVDPDICLMGGFSAVGHFDLALLMGCQDSTLDQVSNGDLGVSTNTLRTNNRDAIVPIVDARVGLKYQIACFHVEAGYQFTEYFKAVNLVFPVFLTGLEQINSNLILSGPYATLGLSF